MIKAVIFDCFGVLYVDTSRYFYENNVTNYEQLRPELLNLNKAYDYGLLDQADLDEAVSELTGLELEFVSEHIQGKQQRNQVLLDYAQSLRSDRKVGMLSNIGLGAMDKFFDQTERQELFDAVVLSGEEGITKPHPHIYQIMAERLGVSPGECLMIDDLEENCAGADAAGMRAVHYQDNQQTIKAVNIEIQKNLT